MITKPTNEFTDNLCLALGINPDVTRRIIIDICVNEPILVYTESYGTDKLIEIKWADGLQGAIIQNGE